MQKPLQTSNFKLQTSKSKLGGSTFEVWHLHFARCGQVSHATLAASVFFCLFDVSFYFIERPSPPFRLCTPALVLGIFGGSDSTHRTTTGQSHSIGSPAVTVMDRRPAKTKRLVFIVLRVTAQLAATSLGSLLYFTYPDPMSRHLFLRKKQGGSYR